MVTAISTSWPTPVASMVANGFLVTISSSCVLRQERTRVVARHAEAGLREVVGPEAEELRRLRDLVGRQRAARDLDHRADHVVQLDLLLRLHLAGRLVHDLDLQIQLLLEADERDHDLGPDLDAFLLDLGRGFEHRPRLHRRDFRIADAEAAAAEAEHRVELVQLLDALMDARRRHADLLRQLLLLLLGVRQELVERRVEEANRRRVALQRPEDAGEVLALIRQQLGERGLARLDRSRPGSSPASHRCDRPRRTCARCG